MSERKERIVKVTITEAIYNGYFGKLLNLLDACANAQDGCQRCRVLDQCRGEFDRLMNKDTHYPVSRAEFESFVTFFKNLKIEVKP